MISLISGTKALSKIADKTREKRLAMDLTQDGLSKRSGVPLATLRKFEQKGLISLEAFIKLLMVLGGVEELITALSPPKQTFSSIDEVLREVEKTGRKRGNRQ